MRCEVCGSKINSPLRALIEGARLTVCIECSKYGKIVREDDVEPGQKAPRKAQLPISAKMPKKKTFEAKVEITQEVVEGYHVKIRQAREKLGLSHEELGKRINEKASVLSKLETGKMTPNNILVSKLEHALKIKLLVSISEDKIPENTQPQNRELTLGDLIQLRKKGTEEQTERKQS